MKAKRRSVAKRPAFGSCLSLDLFKHRKWPFHGTWSGLALMIVGSVVAVTLISVIGLIIFVPSAGTMVTKFLRQKAILR